MRGQFGEVGLRGAWDRCHAGRNRNSGLRADKNKDEGCKRYIAGNVSKVV